MKRFVYLEHTADYMVEVVAKNKELLFINTGYAISNIMYNLEKVILREVRVFEFKGENFYEMFKNFVATLILTVCKDYFLYRKVSVNLKRKKYEGTAKIVGEPIDKSKHELFKEIKALTEHSFKLEKKGRIRRAVFVVDV